MKASWLQFLIEAILVLILVLGCLILYALGLDEVPDAVVKLQLLVISGIAIMLITIEIILCSSKCDALPIIDDEEDDKCRRKR